MGVYCFQVVRDSDFVSAQYLENELMECIRMENGIYGRTWYRKNVVGWVIEYRKGRLWKGT